MRHASSAAVCQVQVELPGFVPDPEGVPQGACRVRVELPGVFPGPEGAPPEACRVRVVLPGACPVQGAFAVACSGPASRVITRLFDCCAPGLSCQSSGLASLFESSPAMQPQAGIILPDAGLELILGPLPAPDIDEFQCPCSPGMSTACRQRSDRQDLPATGWCLAIFQCRTLCYQAYLLNRDSLPAPATRVILSISSANRL